VTAICVATGRGGHGWSARSTGQVGPAVTEPNTPLLVGGPLDVVVDEMRVDVIGIVPIVVERRAGVASVDDVAGAEVAGAEGVLPHPVEPAAARTTTLTI
jgi:hypothetical protein